MTTCVRMCGRKPEAEGVLLIVINGNKGHGFSCQALEYMAGAIPDFLETVAKELRGDLN